MSEYIICDIDGCLIPQRGFMWDFMGLQKVAEIARNGQVVLALCSGRPPAFQEALARQLMITSYCICENGAILMHPITKKTIINPAISSEFLRERSSIYATLSDLVKDKPAVLEFGKEILISVNPLDKRVLAELQPAVEDALKGAPVQLFNSGRSIEVMPLGVSKRTGLYLWAEIAGVPVESITAIGDADNDLDILRTAGITAAPANCTPNVRETVDYVSSETMVRGVIDILEWTMKGTWPEGHAAQDSRAAQN